jgi:hypothetical protein
MTFKQDIKLGGCADSSRPDSGLSILGGVFGLFSFQSFFFVGEVSVVLLPFSVVLRTPGE